MKAFLSVAFLCIATILFTAPRAFAQRAGECEGLSLPTLTFSANAYAASQFSAELTLLKEAMQANPACKIVVMGGGGGTKVGQEMSWQRVNAVISYMNDTHDISRSRFIFLIDEPGNPNTVTLRPATEGEDGPSSIPEPHPGLRR